MSSPKHSTPDDDAWGLDGVANLLITNETAAAAKPGVLDWFRSWWRSAPGTCLDVRHHVRSEHDPDLEREAWLAVRWSFLAYAFPTLWTTLPQWWHETNVDVNAHVTQFMALRTLECTADMDDILRGTRTEFALPPSTPVAGFYLRTPIRRWLPSGTETHRWPPWARRHSLLDGLMLPPVHAYILRQPVADEGRQPVAEATDTGRQPPDAFDLLVVFRGTASEVQGLPQYGRHLHNTQIYRYPCFDPFTRTLHLHPEELNTPPPLVYPSYVASWEDAWPHIHQALQWLDLEHARRVVFIGHSLGAALVTVGELLLYDSHPDLWRRSVFRAIACPLVLNKPAVQLMEQRLHDAGQRDQHIEVVNVDDVMNVRREFGDSATRVRTWRGGATGLGWWLIESWWTQHPPVSPSWWDNLAARLRASPQQALSAFVSGAMPEQWATPVTHPAESTRLGQDVAGAAADTHRTLRLLVCQRRIQWQDEYAGRSHIDYMDLNFLTLWLTSRSYEDRLYHHYTRHSLRADNAVRLVALFPPDDLARIRPQLRAYLRRVHSTPHPPHPLAPVAREWAQWQRGDT